MQGNALTQKFWATFIIIMLNWYWELGYRMFWIWRYTYVGYAVFPPGLLQYHSTLLKSLFLWCGIKMQQNLKNPLMSATPYFILLFWDEPWVLYYHSPLLQVLSEDAGREYFPGHHRGAARHDPLSQTVPGGHGSQIHSGDVHGGRAHDQHHWTWAGERFPFSPCTNFFFSLCWFLLLFERLSCLNHLCIVEDF